MHAWSQCCHYCHYCQAGAQHTWPHHISMAWHPPLGCSTLTGAEAACTVRTTFKNQGRPLIKCKNIEFGGKSCSGHTVDSCTTHHTHTLALLYSAAREKISLVATNPK